MFSLEEIYEDFENASCLGKGLRTYYDCMYECRRRYLMAARRRWARWLAKPKNYMKRKLWSAEYNRKPEVKARYNAYWRKRRAEQRLKNPKPRKRVGPLPGSKKCKLDWNKVREIRKLYSNRKKRIITLKKIASKYRVSITTIYDILKGNSWLEK